MRSLHLPALLSLLGGSSACVVPVGPEWTDPPTNYPPTIARTAPASGSLLTREIDGGGPLSVTVWLADQNTRDKLYVRFIIDYPPFIADVTRVAPEVILPPENQVERQPLAFAPDCNADLIASGFTNHRLMLAASDRPFASAAPDQTAPDQVAPGNARVEGFWQFEMDCP